MNNYMCVLECCGCETVRGCGQTQCISECVCGSVVGVRLTGGVDRLREYLNVCVGVLWVWD